MKPITRLSLAGAIAVAVILVAERISGITLNGETSPITAALTVAIEYGLRKLGLSDIKPEVK
jgi:hypothetical protein